MLQYIIFAIILIVTNMVTFRFTMKNTVNRMLKELEDMSKDWMLNKRKMRKSRFGGQDRDGDGVERYLFGFRHNAQDVLTTLKEAVDKYGSVSLADYHDIIKVESSYKDNNYGWSKESFSGARIVTVRDGMYTIEFPPLEIL